MFLAPACWQGTKDLRTRNALFAHVYIYIFGISSACVYLQKSLMDLRFPSNLTFTDIHNVTVVPAAVAFVGVKHLIVMWQVSLG